MKGVWGIVALTLALGAPAWALDGAKVNVDLPELKAKADEVVEVNLEGETLERGSRLLAIKDGMSGSVKGLLGGLKGIYRRTYRFAAGQSYEEEPVHAFRQKMSGGGWAPLLNVEDKGKKEAVTVYSYKKEDGESGVTVVSQDPSEVTVVNIVGDVDLDTLIELGVQMGVPSMHVATTEIEKNKVALPEAPAPKK